MLTGSQDNGIQIFAVSSPDHEANEGPRQTPAVDLLLKHEAAHSADVNCVRWHPTEPDILASSGDDNSVKLWRVREQTFPQSPHPL